MKEQAAVESAAAALRRAFDGSFALPPTQAQQELEDLLSVRVAGDPYAIRLREIAGVVARRAIVPLPSTAPGLLGLAGIRGAIVPVFGLASFLGYGPDSAPPGWVVVCGAEEPLALGFAELEGYLRLPRSALHARGATHPLPSGRQYVDQLAQTDAGPRPVIDLHAIVATIRTRPGPTPPHKGK